jgi:DNA-directed RNA polymerase subunit M/transcription elongation factor TFIIS
MNNIKLCPRCGSNLYPGSDMHGKYECCWQCGYYKDLDKEGKEYVSEEKVSGGAFHQVKNV